MPTEHLYTTLPKDIVAKINKVSRIVVKIGTNVLMGSDGTHRKQPDLKLLESIVTQIIALKKQHKEVILVSSGAIGFGAAELNISFPITDIPTRQACAAIGQPLLMNIYRDVFSKYKSYCAQLLLTGNDFVYKSTYQALQNCIEVLLKKSVTPIINENDSVSVEEIGIKFGDNDRLSAMVATKTSSELLIILTDVDALYDKNPKKFNDAKKIHYVNNISYLKENFIKEHNAGTGSDLGTGGIYTKIVAAELAIKEGCMTAIGLAIKENILIDLLQAKNVGTIIAN